MKTVLLISSLLLAGAAQAESWTCDFYEERGGELVLEKSAHFKAGDFRPGQPLRVLFEDEEDMKAFCHAEARKRDTGTTDCWLTCGYESKEQAGISNSVSFDFDRELEIEGNYEGMQHKISCRKVD
jgi:hypothetical protein